MNKLQQTYLLLRHPSMFIYKYCFSNFGKVLNTRDIPLTAETIELKLKLIDYFYSDVYKEYCSVNNLDTLYELQQRRQELSIDHTQIRPNVYFTFWTSFLLWLLSAKNSIPIFVLIIIVAFYGVIIYGQVQYSSVTEATYFSILREYELKLITKLIDESINLVTNDIDK
ncbi:hypothetical protein [Turicibacter sanguinis]|uniref:hypothetical protein n=1 Tax=Turicibacter sanguinis TaxID=154288 RepID=UPI00232E1E86|nr:hypothetical protein [Turicibacter sanguinis]MDB8575620.1 hypothetical protein [Turicibacter sanguinis]MDB8578744.1 hypothetical protein [Turicibacter sanguinis]MDB8584067.1 hypothetical protein [Turicibacter sanguinis]MDB8588126.1 hypothetical protein [Turicibacter sanguinis]MDB8598134.1 hypothetical protein [Turicibacter sanguinis]